MKSRIILIAVMCCMTALSATAQENRRQIVVLHTNDTHSTVMPLSENLNDTMKAARGGFLRRVTMVREERAKEPELLLFDSGDFSQGSPYYTLYKGDVEVRLMNRMQYDAATIGNHEFDFGLENMARIFRMAEFPIVCANYDFTGTPVEGLVRPYVVLQRKGLRIGVFGLSPNPDGLVSKENYRGMTFADPIEKTREITRTLRDKEHCDVIVCLSHLGWQQAKPDLDDNTLIAATRDIDLVLGGHSHTYLKELEWVYNADGHAVPVDQNGKHGIFVGKITLNVEK